jgi:hypothetical protein
MELDWLKDSYEEFRTLCAKQSGGQAPPSSMATRIEALYREAREKFRLIRGIQTTLKSKYRSLWRVDHAQNKAIEELELQYTRSLKSLRIGG